ncbi:MAG: hypothetical protein JWL70_2514 [Acidimicrobiia bacterium]|nr:hypothetical protein [Acidimicrobiia bacterium]
MALQGTLDTFGLPDVLRLLAGTRKTGRLRVTGDRADGSVWLDGGAIVAGKSSSLTAQADLAMVVFDLLRCRGGSFVFEPDMVCPEAGAPTEVETLVIAAEALLAEWREIEAVVPSLAIWVSLSPELPRPEVVVSAARWRALVAVGSGAQVGAVAEDLDLDELAASRLVKELVELGLVELAEAMPDPELDPEPDHDPVPLDASGAEQAETTGLPTLDPQLAAIDAVAAGSHDGSSDQADESWQVGEPWSNGSAGEAPPSRTPAHLGIDIPGLPSLGGWGADEAETDDRPGQSGDVSVELGPLTARAARAIAAAAQASNEAEREAAIEQAIASNDQPLDRGVLLRFLSSVRQ